MSRRSNHECRERLCEDELLCVEIVEDTDLLRHLETPKHGLLNWHAILDLEKFTQDITTTPQSS